MWLHQQFCNDRKGGKWELNPWYINEPWPNNEVVDSLRRVDLELEHQNHDLLDSMNTRTRMHFQLQHSAEILSRLKGEASR